MSSAKNLNVMVLGKSGVGKSSLLNYLADKEIVKSGIGAPVTKEGEFNEYNNIECDYLSLNIIDTWGLETDKLPRWSSLIQNEIKRRGDTPEHSIHALIYVVSGSTGRFEDMEVNIIEKILREHSQHLIVVLSNSKDMKSELENYVRATLANLKNKVAKDTKNNNINCNVVKVNSVADSAFGDDETYGKKELLDTLADIAWNSLVNFYIKEIYQEKTVIINDMKETLSIDPYVNVKYDDGSEDTRVNDWTNYMLNTVFEQVGDNWTQEKIKTKYEEIARPMLIRLIDDTLAYNEKHLNFTAISVLQSLYSEIMLTYKQILFRANSINISDKANFANLPEIIKINDIMYDANSVETNSSSTLAISILGGAGIGLLVGALALGPIGWIAAGAIAFFGGNYLEEKRNNEFIDKIEQAVKSNIVNALDSFNEKVEEVVNRNEQKILDNLTLKFEEVLLANHPIRK